MAIPDHLRGCPLFLELFDTEVEKVVKYCTVYTFESGDPIIQDGEEGSEILIMLEGEAMVRKKTLQGVLDIQRIKTGDVFGELVLVDERKRSADVVALEKSYVLEIKYDDVFKLFKSEPQVFGLMILNLSRLLAKRLRASNEFVVRLKKGEKK